MSYKYNPLNKQGFSINPDAKEVNFDDSSTAMGVNNVQDALGQLDIRVDNLVAGAGDIFSPVQSIAALKAIDTTNTEYADKGIINVEDNGLYRFDRQSVLVESIDKIIAPTLGPGRWIKMSASINEHNLLSNLQGGTTGQYNHITDLELNRLQNLPDDTGIQQIIKVGLSGDVDFTSIKDAVDSITDNTISKRYTITVAPGVYVENMITMKPFVNIEGVSDNMVIIQNFDGNDDTIVTAPNSAIYKCVIQGAIGPGAALFRGVNFSGLGTFGIHDCTFGACDSIFVSALTAGQFNTISMSSFGLVGLSPIKNGFDISGDGQTLVSVVDSKNLITSAMTDFIHIRGASNRIITTNFGLIVSPALGGSLINFIRCYDGATVDGFSIGVDGAFDVIHNENIGSGCNVRFNNFIALNTTNKVIQILQPTTTGSFSGTATKSKVQVDSPNFSLFYNEPFGGNILSGEFTIGDTNQELVSVNSLIIDSGNIGLYEGGGLSIDSGLSLSYGGGYGYLKNSSDIMKKHTWLSGTMLLPSNQVNYVYVDEGGDITCATALPAITEFILLGKVATNGSSIQWVDSEKPYGKHYDALDTVKNVELIGANVASGLVVSINGTDEIDVSSGVYFHTVERLTPSGGISIPMIRIKRDGGSYYTFESPSSLVPLTVYDLNGTLTTLTGGFFGKHLICVSGDGINEKYYLIYSQSEYSTQGAAEAAPRPQLPNGFDRKFIPIATVVYDSSSIVSIQDVRPLLATVQGGGGAVSDHGQLTGLLDDDHLQYLLASGARPMSGNLNMSSNQITNAGNINGVSVTSHSSRHLPNGADPLTTGVPSTIGTVNSIGTANAFARQDHVHAHGNQAGGNLHSIANAGTAGFMSGNDFTLLNSVLGTVWYTGLAFSATTPTPTQTLNYTNGQYYINGVLKTITPSGNLGLSSHFTALASGEKAWLMITANAAGSLVQTLGTPVSGNSQPVLPSIPVGEVCLYFVFIKKSAGDIENDDLVDCRRSPQGAVGTDRFVRVSPDDTLSKTLVDALTNTGNVQFTVNGAAETNQTMSASVDLSGKAGVSHSHANATISTDGFMSSTDKSKLDGIATGATANSSDVTLLGRANHTGTQLANTISNFDSAVAANSAVTANSAKITNATHTGEVTGSTALTITNNAVTNSKLAQMPANTIKGNNTGAPANAIDLTVIQIRDLINVADGATANSTDATLLNRANHTGTQVASTISDIQTTITNNAAVVANTAKVTNATHTGDVTGSTALTIANGAVTYAKMQNVAGASRLLGRGSAAGAGVPQEISLGTGLTMTGTVLSTTSGGTLVTKSGVIAAGSFIGSPDKKATVAFAGAFLDANYSMTVVGIDARAWTIESVTSGSFVINANSNSALTGNVYWTAIKHGES